jgi:hypothetical protein
MSRDNIGEALDAAIRNRRKYASFFDWPDKAVKEWDVVCELLSSMHARGDYRYTHKFDRVDGDWPDCVIRDSSGVQIGVEVTEFVDEKAVEICERGENVYREWSHQAVREKIAQILKRKDEKAHHGGLYGKLILVIHTDEFELTSSRLFHILADSVFPLRNIDEAYLICSYEPTLDDAPNPYPYVRLNLDGQPSDLGLGLPRHRARNLDGSDSRL